MAIDRTTETILSLRDATREVPPLDGKKVHISTLWRWARKGVRGVKLEYIQLGHRVATSREAIDRFFAALVAVEPEPTERPRPVHVSKTRTSASRQRAVERAEKRLIAMGA